MISLSADDLLALMGSPVKSQDRVVWSFFFSLGNIETMPFNSTKIGREGEKSNITYRIIKND